MSAKLKFKPEITQIKLNPEQAVLACTCWARGLGWRAAGTAVLGTCVVNTRGTSSTTRTVRSTSVS